MGTMMAAVNNKVSFLDMNRKIFDIIYHIVMCGDLVVVYQDCNVMSMVIRLKIDVNVFFFMCNKCTVFNSTERHCAKFNSEKNYKEGKKKFLAPFSNFRFHNTIMCYLCFKINFNLYFCSISKLQFRGLMSMRVNSTKIAIFKWHFLKMHRFR